MHARVPATLQFESGATCAPTAAYAPRPPHFPLPSMSTTTTAKTTAFMKALKPSAALAVIVGSDPLPRTEVTKRIWDYIKAHNLQNPANKRNILCDAPLRAVMGKDEVTMFEMACLIGKRLGPK